MTAEDMIRELQGLPPDTPVIVEVAVAGEYREAAYVTRPVEGATRRLLTAACITLGGEVS